MRKKTKKERKIFKTPLAVVYFILRLLVVGVMVAQILNRNYNNVFLCILTLLLFMIPSFIEKKIKIDVPDTLETIVLLFIFAAEILGEIREYYITFPYWDTMLHTLNGFLCAAIGVSMIDILNRSEKFSIKLSPTFVALVAFCFSMTIGVLWEFFEFGMDTFFLTDMQKDRYISTISSVMLNPDGSNVAVVLPVESVIVNGVEWPGYIDIGLIDTMKDLLVNFIGAIVFSLIGGLYVKGRARHKFAQNFFLTPIADDDSPSDDKPTSTDEATASDISLSPDEPSAIDVPAGENDGLTGAWVSNQNPSFPQPELSGQHIYAETKRLILRTAKPEDVDSLMKIRNSPYVMKYETLLPLSREDVVNLIAQDAASSDALYLELRETAQLIGSIHIESDSSRHAVTAFIISYFLSEEFSSNGYMTEALQAVLRILFEQREAELVSARVFSGNEASVRLLTRLGFTCEGKLRNAVRGSSGKLFDGLLFSILREDYFNAPDHGSEGSDVR